MKQTIPCAAAVLAFSLSACSPAGDTPAPPDPASSATPIPASSPSGSAPETPLPAASPPPGYTDGGGINEGYPDLTPVPLAPDDERTEKGARNVLLSFTRAIELREYDQAWNMLGSGAKATWSKARFNTLFDGLDDVMVSAPTGTMEGAAGSSYYSAQAEITAKDADGRPIRLEGPIVLRRVNDVDGAAPEDLVWHIESVDLTQTH